MRKAHSLLLLVAVLFSTGCGRNYMGTYVGTQTFTLPTISSNAPQTTTLTITQASSSMVSGSWSGSVGSGTFTGVPSGNGDFISNVNMTVSNLNTAVLMQGYGTTGITGMNPYGSTMSCGPYIGSLSLSPNNQLTGTVTFPQATTANATTAYCPTSITLNLTRQGNY